VTAEDKRSGLRRRRRYRVTVGSVSWFTTDVSAGGFSCEVMRVLPVGSAVEGSIDVRGTGVAFLGDVAWAERGDWHLNVRGRMGVRFKRIGAEAALLFGGAGALPSFTR
jgi:PilZ domain